MSQRSHAPRPRADARVAELEHNGHEYAVMSWRIDGGARFGELTPGEREVVAAVIQGASNRDIARLRNTSPRTVANQLASIYRKLGVHSRGELAALRHTMK